MVKTGTLVKQKVYTVEKTVSEPFDIYRYGIILPLEKFFEENVKNANSFVRVFWQPTKELPYTNKKRLNIEVVKAETIEIVKEVPSYV